MNVPLETPREILALTLWLQRRESENNIVRSALVAMEGILQESRERQQRIAALVAQIDALTLAEEKRKAQVGKKRVVK